MSSTIKWGIKSSQQHEEVKVHETNDWILEEIFHLPHSQDMNIKEWEMLSVGTKKKQKRKKRDKTF